MKGTAKKPMKHDWEKESYEEYRREIVRDSIRKRREKARKEGLCPICMKRLPPVGKITCEKCCKRIADKAWEKRNGRPRG